MLKCYQAQHKNIGIKKYARKQENDVSLLHIGRFYSALSFVVPSVSLAERNINRIWKSREWSERKNGKACNGDFSFCDEHRNNRDAVRRYKWRSWAKSLKVRLYKFTIRCYGQLLNFIAKPDARLRPSRVHWT